MWIQAFPFVTFIATQSAFFQLPHLPPKKPNMILFSPILAAFFNNVFTLRALGTNSGTLVLKVQLFQCEHNHYVLGHGARACLERWSLPERAGTQSSGGVVTNRVWAHRKTVSRQRRGLLYFTFIPCATGWLLEQESWTAVNINKCSLADDKSSFLFVVC